MKLMNLETAKRVKVALEQRRSGVVETAHSLNAICRPYDLRYCPETKLLWGTEYFYIDSKGKYEGYSFEGYRIYNERTRGTEYDQTERTQDVGTIGKATNISAAALYALNDGSPQDVIDVFSDVERAHITTKEPVEEIEVEYTHTVCNSYRMEEIEDLENYIEDLREKEHECNAIARNLYIEDYKDWNAINSNNKKRDIIRMKIIGNQKKVIAILKEMI